MMPKKRNTTRVIFASSMLIAIAQCVHAEVRQPCTAAIVRGHYGFLITGTHIGIGQYGLLGTIEADGAGHLHGGGLQSINGNQAEVSFAGTYQVTPECTGTTELTFEDKMVGHVRFVVVEGGNEILLMDYGAHTVETGYAKRQFATVDLSDNGPAKP